MSATILIIDDNPTNRKLASYVLATDNYKVVEAKDAQEAWTVLAGTSPDLILMDIQMPGMDGLTLTRLIKANPAYHRVRIVALTSHAMKGDEEKARAAGCDGYITKPIDTVRLPQQVGDYLRVESSQANQTLS